MIVKTLRDTRKTVAHVALSVVYFESSIRNNKIMYYS
jgi:hypothetical protein